MQWFRRKGKQVRTMHRHSRIITVCICLAGVKAQVQSSAVVSKEREASQNYAQALPKKYYLYCVLQVKAQVQSSAVILKER